MFRNALIVLVCSVLTACSQFDVTSDYSPDTDFSKYRTFHLKRDAKVQGDRLADNDFAQRRVQAAIEGNLVQKGFNSVAEESADLIILTYAGVQEKVNLSTYGYSAGPYWGPYYGGGYHSTQTVVTKYDEGTLYIDIFDRASKSLVGRDRALVYWVRLAHHRNVRR